MWFKNLRLFRFTQPFTLGAAELQEQLQEKAFHPCGRQELFRYGWVPPLPVALTADQEPQFVHACNGYLMLCLQREDKVLPAAVVRDAVTERCRQIEQQQARKVFRKERDQIKDEVMLELLPRAFSKSQRIFGYIAPREKLLLIDAASASKAELFTSHLRDSLGPLPIILPASKQAPVDAMTQWLTQQQAPSPFVLEKDCELSNPADSANVIRCKAQELEADEVQTMLESGKRCTKLAMTWNDCLQCVVQDDLSVKRLRFADELLEQASEGNIEDQAQQFDQDFAVMSLELSRFCKDLFKAFGGLERTRVV